MIEIAMPAVVRSDRIFRRRIFRETNVLNCMDGQPSSIPGSALHHARWLAAIVDLRSFRPTASTEEWAKYSKVTRCALPCYKQCGPGGYGYQASIQAEFWRNGHLFGTAC